jgi:hypothetical protein
MVFTRGNICLAINLITKCHECSFLFYLSLYLFSSFCGDSSDSAPTNFCTGQILCHSGNVFESEFSFVFIRFTYGLQPLTSWCFAHTRPRGNQRLFPLYSLSKIGPAAPQHFPYLLKQQMRKGRHGD